MNNQTAQPSSGLFSLLFLWAIWGAIADYRYKKNGGIAPTKRHRIYYWTAVGCTVGTIILFGVASSNPEAVGQLAASLVMFIFIITQFARWRVRRENPLSKTTRLKGL